MDEIRPLDAVVRRVIAARVRHPELIEDLTQETLTRVTRRRPDLAGDARQAYAITTARNLVVDHVRTTAREGRHEHLLRDVEVDGPEDTVVRREEADALRAAMAQLPNDDLELLERHDVNKEPLTAIAADASISPGALAMRLARARTHLRLEFLLAFRGMTLPSERCRAVLLALSSGDRRLQTRLDASGHVERCGTCATLAPPISKRRRDLAGWGFAAVAEYGRRLAGSVRSNTRAQVTLGFAVGVAVAATTVVLSQQTPSDEARSPEPSGLSAAPAPSPETSPAGATAPATTPLAMATSPGVAATAATTPSSSPTACPPPAPVDQLPTPPPLGCPVAATVLVATDVAHDEGFWAESDFGRDLWVQLEGDGESPVRINPGTRVIVTGRTTPPNQAPAVAADERIAAAGFFLTVNYDQITVD